MQFLQPHSKIRLLRAAAPSTTTPRVPDTGRTTPATRLKPLPLAGPPAFAPGHRAPTPHRDNLAPARSDQSPDSRQATIASRENSKFTVRTVLRPGVTIISSDIFCAEPLGPVFQGTVLATTSSDDLISSATTPSQPNKATAQPPPQLNSRNHPKHEHVLVFIYTV